MGHSLEVNGINSNDYGVIISGGGTYATPRRKVTSTQVPGRNGDIQYDENAFENCIVTYPCGIAKGFESDYLPFIRKLKAQPVYSKITDTYHPQYFRYGTVIEEMVPEVGTILRSGKFDLQFDCKPQRFLTSGDTPIAYIPEVKIIPPSRVYSDFSARTQSDVLQGQLRTLGYTSQDIQSMDYLVASTSVGGGLWVSIECEQSDQFFACVMDADPLTAGSGLLTYTYYTDKQFYLNSSTWGSGTIYIIVQRLPVLKVYAGGSLVFDYDYYTEFALTNPTDYTAHPYIRAEVVDNTFYDYLFGINGCSMKMTHSNEDGNLGIHAIVVDTETMNVFSLPDDNDDRTLINCNKYCEFSNWSISLHPGVNNIYGADWCTKIELTPRWWTL